MLQIITSTNVPDNTYFRVGSVEPELNGDALTIYTGQGTHRSSWGAPGVTSTVILTTEDLVVVHVGFHHKHGGGQFWRYYRFDGQWRQVAWAALSDQDRERVLVAYEDRAPSWAKVPGKLRANYARPEMKTYTTYKIVAVEDGKYVSLFDRETEYVMGKRLAEKAVSDHGGGYYSYPTAEGVEALFHAHKLVPEQCYEEAMMVAVIECEISGTILTYQNGKYASTYLRPIKELKRFVYSTTVEEAC